MLTLTVTQFNGTALPTPIKASFDETGGAIGRAETNALVLPDPERTISRVHARVSFRAGAYVLIDEGSNAVVHNGQPLGKGREAPLRPGDRLQIGGYLVNVAAGAASGAAADPFADFFGLAAAPAPAPPAYAPAPPAYAPAPPARSSQAAADPLGLGFGPAPTPSPAPSPAFGGIPDDWDPFAATPVPPGRAAAPSPGANALGLDFGAGAPSPLIPDLPRASGGSDSLDQLFGLGAPSTASRNNPLANSLLDAPVAQPNLAAHADPLRSLSELAPGSMEARRDDSSELNRPFALPPLPKPVQAAIPAPSPAGFPDTIPAAFQNTLPAPQLSAEPAAPVLSWDAPAAAGHTIIRPAAKPAPEEATRMPPPPAPAAPVLAAGSSAAGSAELLEAFRQGLGQTTLGVQTLDPAFMRLVGELLREATQGTVDLLVARAEIKREVRAQATVIMAKENNPLKFSPSGEAALGHLLGPPVRGFMAPAKAMRDAFDDLRAHQLAFLSGMRAAMEGLLSRFDPAALEGRLTQKSVLQSLLPGARKAQLWAVFQQEYAQIAREAGDDFQDLFGREFLRAYEAQIDALKDG
jgi:FHA domain-containing protein